MSDDPNTFAIGDGDEATPSSIEFHRDTAGRVRASASGPFPRRLEVSPSEVQRLTAWLSQPTEETYDASTGHEAWDYYLEATSAIREDDPDRQKKLDAAEARLNATLSRILKESRP